MSTQSQDIVKLKIDMAEQRKDISYIKTAVDTISRKFDCFVESCESKFSRKQEVDELRTDTDDKLKTVEQRIDKSEKFVNKVMWTAVIGIVGFLVQMLYDIFSNKIEMFLK